MTSIRGNVQQTLIIVAVFASAAAAQQPSQFKANVKMENSDGTNATGMMYFGGAKMRTELTVDGQSIVVLADPKAKSQYVLMPSEKVYMQMPIGQGPVSIPITGPSDPTNPCAGGSGNTDCKKGANESVNGYETVRWDYTNAEGVRTRAWVSTKLRFPVKSQGDNGSSMEFSNIAEGPQPATLFGIPSGYTKMDMGAMGGGGRGGRSNADDPIAAAMANMSPEAAAALAAARRGDVPRGGASAPTGSGWEKTKGWILNVTIVGTSKKPNNEYAAKYVASIPLNYGTPAVAGFNPVGAMWTHMVGGGGTAEALAAPFTLSAEASSRVESAYAGACAIDEDPYKSVATMKGSGKHSGSMTEPDLSFRGQAVFKLAPDLKTYDLLASLASAPVKEATDTHTEGTSCRTKAPYTKNKSETKDVPYGFSFELNGLPLPASVSTVTGTKTMPMTLSGHEVTATINWTLAPIR